MPRWRGWPGFGGPGGAGGFWRLGHAIQLAKDRAAAGMGLLLRRCRGQGPHLRMTGEPRDVSRVVAGFSSFDADEALGGGNQGPSDPGWGSPTCWFPQLPGTVRSAQEAKPVSVWGMLTCSSSSQLRDLSPQPRVTPGKPNRKRLEDRTEEPQWRSDAGNQLGG